MRVRCSTASLLIAVLVLLSINIYRLDPTCSDGDNANKLAAVGSAASEYPSVSDSSNNLRPRNVRQNKKQLVPDRLVVVSGLESSGTTFVFKSLALAMGLKIKDGQDSLTDVDGSIRIQHISLPTGGGGGGGAGSSSSNMPPVVPLWIPPLCTSPFPTTRNPRAAPRECHEAYGPTLRYQPGRYFVNLTSHVQWHQQQHPAAEVQTVVVVRDVALHFFGILQHHVGRNATAAYQEYRLGRQLLQEAVSTIRPILVVSYESLLTLQETYWRQVVYPALNISSDWVPTRLENGNLKYSQSVPQELLDELQSEKETKRGATTSSAADKKR